LDWFSYLNNDDISIHTKHLKGIDKHLAEVTSNKLQQEDAETAAKHQKVINQFLDLCKLVQICEMQKGLEERQQMMHQNPQQDDSEPNAINTATLPMSSNIQMYYQTSTHKEIPLSMTKGVTSKNRRDKYQR
jgi:hypothetical protein